MKVTVDGLTVAYDGRTVLHDVDLAIESGEHVGLIGPNGSGKSTLLRCLYRAISPASGRILLDDTDVTALPRRRTAQLIAAVTQSEGSVFGFSVAETVALGRYAHRDSTGPEAMRLCREAMRSMDIDDLADRSVLTLSGGQRQRVAIARAIAQDTPVLLLDEPLNHLDVRHQLTLIRHLRATRQTTLMAVHDLNLAAQSCDRLILLDEGRVVADGPPDRVLDPALLDAVYGVRFSTLQAPDGHSVLTFPL